MWGYDHSFRPQRLGTSSSSPKTFSSYSACLLSVYRHACVPYSPSSPDLGPWHPIKHPSLSQRRSFYSLCNTPPAFVYVPDMSLSEALGCSEPLLWCRESSVLHPLPKNAMPREPAFEANQKTQSWDTPLKYWPKAANGHQKILHPKNSASPQEIKLQNNKETHQNAPQPPPRPIMIPQHITHI